MGVMSNIWFTADTHFGHANIIKFCNRPVSSVNEMDEMLVERWNERVKAGDTVYHVGDFAWKNHADYLKRLHGKKHLVLGNHDSLSQMVGLKGRGGWESIWDIMYVSGIDTLPIVLCHYPMRSWNRAFHGAKHLYGHVHGAFAPMSNNLDVGVDCWDHRPVSWDEITARMTGAHYVGRGEDEPHQPVRGQEGVRILRAGAEGGETAAGT